MHREKQVQGVHLSLCIRASLSLLLQQSMRLHQFGICEVSEGHLGVFSVSGCSDTDHPWHESWTGTRINLCSFFMTLLAISSCLLPWNKLTSLPGRCWAWRVILCTSSTVPWCWAWGVISVWQEDLSHPVFLSQLHCAVIHGVLAEGVLSLEIRNISRIFFSGHWAAHPLEG